MYRNPGVSTSLFTLAIIVLFGAPLPASGQATPGITVPPAEHLCATGTNAVKESVLWTLPRGLEPGRELEISFVARFENAELFTETYRVRMPDATGPAAVPVWLGGIRAEGNRPALAKGAELSSRIEIDVLVDGVLERRLDLGELFRIDGGTREGSYALPTVLSTASTLDVESPVHGARRVESRPGLPVPEKMSVCPGANPDYCDIQFDHCIDDCQGSCYDRCQEDWEECMFGTTFRFTTRDLQNARFFGQQCGWYPWWRLSFKWWNGFDVIWLHREYERQVCPTQTYTTFIRSWTTNEVCFQKTSFSCSSSDNPSYMNGCRL